MFKNNKTAQAVRVALIASVATTAFAMPSAFAADEDAADQAERIEVTGSRLTRTDLETAIPITSIDQQQLTDLGIQDVGQFLQSSAAMSGSPVTTTTNNGGNGGTFIDMRGLGSSRTLVLVNGRRPVSSDFQNIPSSMVARIDILKGGASATYGADAVAGVVNIITRTNFDGVEATVQQSSSFDVKENRQLSFSVVAGQTFENGYFVAGVDIVKQDAAYQGDTDVGFLNNPWQVWGDAFEESFYKNGLIGTGPDANVITVGSGSTPCGQYYFAESTGLNNQTNGVCDGGIAKLSDFRDFKGSGPGNDTYNYAPVNFLQTPYNKFNVFIEGGFDINENVSLYSETRINKRTSRQELAAVPYDTKFDPGYKGILPDGTPFNGISKDNFYNPFGEDVIRSRRRMLEGGRAFEQDIVRFQQVIGAKGELGEWTYDLNYNYGYSQTTSTDFGQLNGSNLAKAMGPSFKNADGNIVCGTAAAPIAGCVSMNLFGGAGSVTQEMLDYVTAPLVDASNYTLQVVSGFIGGDLFELPAGPIAGGVGFEYREEKAEAQVDSGKFLSQVTGNKSKGTNGEYDVSSIFTEIRIPVLADAFLAESLEIPVGVRYDDFSAFGGSTTYQVGIEWKVNSDLLVRANSGTVFRAPGISSLFSPANDSFPSATDPCRSGTNWAELKPAQQQNCIAAGVPAGGSRNTDSQQLSKSGGNPELKPEEGDTYTIGFAYSPSFVEGLGVTVDYWSIDLDGVIDSISADDSLKGCYLGGEAALCNNVTRVNGEITVIDERSTNLSKMVAKGIDTEISYSLEALSGDFNFLLSWSHFLERENQVYDSTEFAFKLKEVSGLYEGGTNYAKNKANFKINYKIEDLNIAYSSNYISSITYDDLLYWGTTEGHEYKVDSQLYHDLTVAYSLGDATLSVGVSNLTDEQPPYIEPASNGNTDVTNYRLFGRSWFARLNYKF